MKNYYVYIVKSLTNKLYTGVTIDIEKRISEHNDGNNGSKALRGQRPVYLVWKYGPVEKSEALKIEAAFKKLPRIVKDAIVSGVNVELINEIKATAHYWPYKEVGYVDEDMDGNYPVWFGEDPETLLQECTDEILDLLRKYENG